MFDTGFAADATQLAVLMARMVARFDPEMDGPAAAESLGEVLAGVRGGELLSCQLMERVDRTGEFAADGSKATALSESARAAITPVIQDR